MDIREIAAIALALGGITFGFGKQASSIAILRRDIDAIANLHRLTLEKLHEINLRLEKLDQRVIYCEREQI